MTKNTASVLQLSHAGILSHPDSLYGCSRICMRKYVHFCHALKVMTTKTA
jgi:hypothetical protein